MITATILFIISILFSRVKVNVLVFVLRVVLFHTMLCVGILHYQQVLCQCFDGSEVTTIEGNELVVQKGNCVVEEIKEVDLRSRRGKFIYNRTYNCIGLKQFSQLYFRLDKLP